jgi:hypothetical protein
VPAVGRSATSAGPSRSSTAAAVRNARIR